MVHVTNGDCRKREILDLVICAFQHSHGRTRLVSGPDVRRRVQRSGDGNGAQEYPDASAKYTIIGTQTDGFLLKM